MSGGMFERQDVFGFADARGGDACNETFGSDRGGALAFGLVNAFEFGADQRPGLIFACVKVPAGTTQRINDIVTSDIVQGSSWGIALIVFYRYRVDEIVFAQRLNYPAD